MTVANQPRSDHRGSERLGSAPLGRLLIKLSIPGAVGMLVMSIYNITDTFWVSRLPDGAIAIAALTIVLPLQFLRGAVAMGAHVGVASLVSRRLGEGRHDEANRAAGHAVIMPLVGGVVLAALAIVLADPLLRMCGARDDLLAPAREYFTTVALGSPCIMFMMIVDGLYRGTGNLVTPMLVIGGSAAANLVLDPIFIFGLGPVPALGIRGAAIATVLAQFCGMTVSCCYLWSRRSGFQVGWRELRPRRDILREVARVGAPASVMQLSQSVVMTILNLVLSAHSARAVAAMGVTNRVLMLMWPLVGGLSFGLLPIVGYCYGAGNYRRMWRAARLAVTIASTLGLALSTAFWIGAPHIVGVFGQDPELHELAVMGLRLISATIAITGPQMLAISTLQGMGLGTTAMLLSMSRQVLFLIPAVLVFSSWWGVGGVFGAVPFADFLGFALAGWVMLRVVRRHPHQDHHAPVALDAEPLGLAAS